MEGNTLGGMIPTEVGLLKNLKQLKLSTNSLDQSISSEIGQCKILTTLELPRNTLNRLIPSEIGHISKLTKLILSINFLGGSNLQLTLTYLFFLTGFIPSQIGALTTNAYLQLRDNSLTGSIPESFCRYKIYLFVDEENVTCSLVSEVLCMNN
jgi:hypothetical protein